MVLDVFEGAAARPDIAADAPDRARPARRSGGSTALWRAGRRRVRPAGASAQRRRPGARRRGALRGENSFPLRALLDGGALIPFGTDAPVEPPDPWPGIAVAMARRDPFAPDECASRASITRSRVERAVRAACLDPALVAGRARSGPALARLRRGSDRRQRRRRRGTSRSCRACISPTDPDE